MSENAPLQGLNEFERQRMDELVLMLLGTPKESREVHLEAECSDPALRNAVLDLLRDRERLRAHLDQAHGREETDELLKEETAGDPTLTSGGLTTAKPADHSESTDEPASLPQPDSIGPYEVLRELGRGGMGVVYLARQREPVERRLAIKLVRRNLSSPLAAMRFQAERKAMARLSHPNIAQIYEAGTTIDGFPYFAMEFVEGGLPITEFCDRSKLTVEARIRLFIEVCRGVHHAHQRGIIHRDLKPSNILVTQQQGEPVAKVIDFGLAKALDNPLTDDTQLTLDHLAGTPEYMSPEAFKLNGRETEVDTRSDVFSLGIILYELLCGCRPFDTKGMSFLAKVQHLFQEDPPRPSRRFSTTESVSKLVIVKRRRTDPTSLGRSLSGDLDFVILKSIAFDLESRYGSVAAFATDLRRYMQQKPVSAHPPSKTYRAKKFVRRHRTGVLAAVLVALAMTLGTIGTTVGMVRAHREAETAQQALAEAEELASFLKELFRSSEPGNPARDLTTRQLLDAGAKKVREGFEGQPQAKARILTTIGDIYTHLALYDEAGALLEESLRLWERSGRTSDLGYGELLLKLGRLAEALDQVDDAERYLGEAIAFYEPLGKPLEQAEARYFLAHTARTRGDREGARRLFEQSLEVRERELGSEDPQLIPVLRGLGDLYVSLDRVDLAEQYAQRASRIAEESFQPDHPKVLRTQRSLALIYREKGELEQAQAILERVLELEIGTYGENHPRVAQLVSELAQLFGERSSFEKAEEYYRWAIRLCEEVYGRDSRDLAITLNNFGTLYWDFERYDEAEPYYRQALSIKRRILEPGHSSIAYSVNNLGLIYWKRGQFDEAESLLWQALETWEKNLGPEHRLIAWPLWGLAGVLRDQERYEEAEPLYRRALKIRERSLPANDKNLHVTRMDFAELLRATGRAKAAAELEARNPAGPAETQDGHVLTQEF